MTENAKHQTFNMNTAQPVGRYLFGAAFLGDTLSNLLDVCGLALGLQRGCKLHHALGAVLASIQQHILNKFQQLFVNLLIHISLDLQASRALQKMKQHAFKSSLTILLTNMLKSITGTLPRK
jgi:hypothetical protein